MVTKARRLDIQSARVFPSLSSGGMTKRRDESILASRVATPATCRVDARDGTLFVARDSRNDRFRSASNESAPPSGHSRGSRARRSAILT